MGWVLSELLASLSLSSFPWLLTKALLSDRNSNLLPTQVNSVKTDHWFTEMEHVSSKTLTPKEGKFLLHIENSLSLRYTHYKKEIVMNIPQVILRFRENVLKNLPACPAQHWYTINCNCHHNHDHQCHTTTPLWACLGWPHEFDGPHKFSKYSTLKSQSTIHIVQLKFISNCVPGKLLATMYNLFNHSAHLDLKNLDTCSRDTIWYLWRQAVARVLGWESARVSWKSW
jgi:hypothetical protein